MLDSAETVRDGHDERIEDLTASLPENTRERLKELSVDIIDRYKRKSDGCADTPRFSDGEGAPEAGGFLRDNPANHPDKIAIIRREIESMRADGNVAA